MRKRVCHLFVLLLITLSLCGCKSSNQLVNNTGSGYVVDYGEDALGEISGKKSKYTNGESGEERKLVAEAYSWLGTRYRYGGEDRRGVDCSGLTMQVYKSAWGIKLPRTSSEQQRFCHIINKDRLQVGDLLFFATSSDKTKVSHVGIYIGDGRMIHSSASRGVIISGINENYFVKCYHSSGYVDRAGRVSFDKKKKHKKEKKQHKTNNTKEIRFEDLLKHDQQLLLDKTIEQKADSIYSDYFD